MYNRMKNWTFVADNDEALKRIKSDTDPFAIFMETPFIKYLQNRDCDLINTGEILGSRPYGIVLQNKSPLTSAVNLQ